jgi:EAL domain-containing protein (putative c-di-GMP-specific phosphodiesterase class I)
VDACEGIEDTSQLAFLRLNGCTEGQGFLFYKAVSAREIPALLGMREEVAAVAAG